MNVLSWANRNVFSWPVSSNVSSEPRRSFGTGWSRGMSVLPDAAAAAAADPNVVVNKGASVTAAGSLVVVCRYVGSVSIYVGHRRSCIIKTNIYIHLRGSPRQWYMHSASVLNRFGALPSQPPHKNVAHSLDVVLYHHL